MKRLDNRAPNQLRPVEITRNFIPHAEGSAFITIGNTQVICTASIEEQVPTWLAEAQQGWITAEYGMLPRATHKRVTREVKTGRPGGRTQEIQRLIGRSLRSVVDLKALPPVTIYLDADVMKADGGTRTAAITGSYVALYDALRFLEQEKMINELPISDMLAATSVGVIEEIALLDLSYVEDSKASVDMNIVMTGGGNFVEIQGTAEKHPFNKDQLEELLGLASKGIMELIDKQKEVLEINNS